MQVCNPKQMIEQKNLFLKYEIDGQAYGDITEVDKADHKLQFGSKDKHTIAGSVVENALNLDPKHVAEVVSEWKDCDVFYWLCTRGFYGVHELIHALASPKFSEEYTELVVGLKAKEDEVSLMLREYVSTE